MNNNFIDFMQKYKNTQIAVAVSGGVDSVCLLYWLYEIGLRPVVLHVNHGLRDVAGVEADYVADTAKKLNLDCMTFDWTGDKPDAGLESAARDARYKLMADYCRENNIEVLLTAHHADDQIETFLMNLARGSGVVGLAAMRDELVRDGIKIVRPLLRVFRSELEQYCNDNKIKYFIDEMNSDEKYTRVRIRKNRNLLAEKLGISDDRILLAIENLGRARDAMEDRVSYLMSHVSENGRAVFNESFLFDPPLEIRLRLLGRLIQKIGGGNYLPRLNSLERALNNLNTDCKFTLGGCVIRRHGDKILIAAEGESSSFRERKTKNAK